MGDVADRVCHQRDELDPDMRGNFSHALDLEGVDAGSVAVKNSANASIDISPDATANSRWGGTQARNMPMNGNVVG
jgi:hypothetical protein